MLNASDEAQKKPVTGKKRGPKPKPKKRVVTKKKAAPKPKPVQVKLPPIKRLPKPEIVYPTEAQEQTSLFEWIAAMSGRYPCLELAFHIPNGGSRNVIEAVHLRDQGVKAGVPDIFIPVSSGGFHGLWIEMKRRGKGTVVSFDQDMWIKRLNMQGYVAGVCYGWDAAAKIIIKYLNLEKIKNKEAQGNAEQKAVDNKGNDSGVREQKEVSECSGEGKTE